MRVTTDDVLFWSIIVLIVGAVTLGIVVSYYSWKADKAFTTYVQVKGYVQLELNNQKFFVRVQDVPEVTQLVQGYEAATAVE